IVVSGDRPALKHALAEIMLNALQANLKSPVVNVRVRTETDGATQDLLIEILDNGNGFTPEAVEKVPSPFFTTRTVGLGLGLTVSRKIIETHHGRLEIIPPQTTGPGFVRVSLPIESALAATA
ncbi:MAG TPA: ATP-binding protein, partial [Candidatus Baltobacteraceae bacterium]|nr:ATP-binding protein [Candidatus Baltobacteraceae bacterium]